MFALFGKATEQHARCTCSRCTVCSEVEVDHIVFLPFLRAKRVNFLEQESLISLLRHCTWPKERFAQISQLMARTTDRQTTTGMVHHFHTRTPYVPSHLNRRKRTTPGSLKVVTSVTDGFHRRHLLLCNGRGAALREATCRALRPSLSRGRTAVVTPNRKSVTKGRNTRCQQTEKETKKRKKV